MIIIAFRIWDKENKKFCFSGSTPSMLSSFFKNTAVLNTRDEMPYQQYTGLSDKNNVWIYEGDVVNHLFHKETFQVIWNEKRASFIALYLEGTGRYSGGVKDNLFGIDNIHYEVIGNIYENPDLLK